MGCAEARLEWPGKWEALFASPSFLGVTPLLILPLSSLFPPALVSACKQGTYMHTYRWVNWYVFVLRACMRARHYSAQQANRGRICTRTDGLITWVNWQTEGVYAHVGMGQSMHCTHASTQASYNFECHDPHAQVQEDRGLGRVDALDELVKDYTTSTDKAAIVQAVTDKVGVCHLYWPPPGTNLRAVRIVSRVLLH
eukprot:893965-Pelagomonas_calceolata.AAC.3